MKKTLLAIAILFSMSTKAQDTTYLHRRNELYMNIRTQVTDSTLYKQHYHFKTAKERRKDRVLTVVMASIFASISAWYWTR
jgi:hypothetical protein